MVQSARVQSIVKGDDVILTHQIMQAVAFNAELSRSPVTLNSGDTVNFFYPLEDPTVTDLIGYPGIPVGSYPESLFTVDVPSQIPASGNTPARGSDTFKSGLGATVRAEIQRLKASPTGNTLSGSTVISSVSSITNVSVGDLVQGAGIPFGTYVASVASGVISLTLPATATASGVSLTITQRETQYMINEVDIFERGFPSSLNDTSGGEVPPQPSFNLT